MTPRRLSIRHPWTRRLLGLVLILGVCAAVVPIPVSVIDWSGKDRSEPFPCQAHACGCMTAAQCWNRCCCLTNEQKVAWSRRHEIEPPDFVIVAARQESATAAAKAVEGKRQDSCCLNDGISKAECTKLKSPWAIAKCSKPVAAKRATAGRATSARPKPAGKAYVLTALVQKCQGHSSFWHSLPWCVVPACFDHSPQATSPDRKIAVSVDRVPFVTHPPPAPPPRV